MLLPSEAAYFDLTSFQFLPLESIPPLSFFAQIFLPPCLAIKRERGASFRCRINLMEGVSISDKHLTTLSRQDEEEEERDAELC